MTTSALGTQRDGAGQDGAAPDSQLARPAGAARPLVVTGAIAAAAAAGTGLVALTLLVLAGWIAAPHAGIGLTGVLRTAAALWLVGHHVGFTLQGPAASACCRLAWCCCPARCSGGPGGGWSAAGG